MASVLRRIVVCGLAIGSALAVRGPAAAQSDGQFPYLASLTADEFVRAGADSRYYPYGRVHTGDVVKVVGEKAGWARVVTLGPAFEDFFGYIKYPKVETARFSLTQDGKSGVTTGATDLFAPNLDAKYDPRSSWKPIATLPADRTLIVLETVAYESDFVHRVKLPPQAEGWIALSHLRPATPTQIATWEAALAKAKPEAPPVKQEVAAAEGQAPLGTVTPNRSAEVDPAVQPVAAGETTEAAPAPAPRPVRSPEARLAAIMLEDLEAAYKRLLDEPIETAEVDPLRGLYLDLAARHTDSRPISAYAATRARQLQLWAEVQQRKLEMIAIQNRAHQTTEEAEAAREMIEAMQKYAAAGQLEASTIYDGKNLPKLFRVRNPETGRTLGYVEPDDRFDYAELIGRRVGVVGDRAYSGSLRLTLIKPERFDILEN